MSITIRFPFHTNSYTLQTDCGEIERVFRDYYPQFCTDSTDGNILITVRRAGERYAVMSAERKFITPDPIARIHNILYETKAIQSGIFAMHAGAVCKEGRAYIFAASTTTGKTTLISYLSARGYEYVSDDCVFIDMADMSVYPFRNAMHLREGGLRVLRDYGALPEGLVYSDERYIYLPDRLSPDQMEPGGIFFLTRTEEENSVAPLSRRDALSRLLCAPVTAYPITADYIRFLHSLTPLCRELKYADMDFVLDCIG